jgi:hypothetical protein
MVDLSMSSLLLWLVLLVLHWAPIGEMPHLMALETRTYLAGPLRWRVLWLSLNYLARRLIVLACLLLLSLLLLGLSLLPMLTRSWVGVPLLLVLTSLPRD